MLSFGATTLRPPCHSVSDVRQLKKIPLSLLISTRSVPNSRYLSLSLNAPYTILLYPPYGRHGHPSESEYESFSCISFGHTQA